MVIGLMALAGLLFPFHQILAYLDPGAGSYLLQLLLATFLGLTFVVKTHWKKIVDYCSKLLRKGKDNGVND